MYATDNGRARAEARDKLEALALEVQTMGGGGRNDALNRAAHILGGYVGAEVLSADEVRETLTAAALEAGLELGETRDTIDSGLKSGANKPFDLSRFEQREQGHARTALAKTPELDKVQNALAKLAPLSAQEEKRLSSRLSKLSGEALAELERRGLVGQVNAFSLSRDYRVKGGDLKARVGALAFEVRGPDGTAWAVKVRNLDPLSRDGLEVPRYFYLTSGHGSPAHCSPDYGTGKRLLIVEGELNGAAAYTALEAAGYVPDFDVQGTGGAKGKPHIDGADRYSEVYVYADPDKAGQDGRESLARLALEAGAMRVFLLSALKDGQDFCEVLGGEGADKLGELLGELLTGAQPYELPANVETQLSDDPWPDQPGELPPPTPPVPELEPELLPGPLRPWLEDISERASIPLEFVAAPAIIAVSAVVGRVIGIKPKRHDDWREVPNLWGGIVGPPGVLKTPAISEATKPLGRLAAASREAFQQDALEAEAAREVLEIELDALRAKVKEATKKGGNVDALRAQLTEKKTEMDALRATERRYMTQDATVEKLGELFAENPRGLLLLRDELAGWLASLDRSGREGDREFYLETWNGNGAYRFDRIGRGSIPIEGMCLSVVGSIQPGKLKAYIREALGGGDGSDGLLQRLQVLVWPDRIGEWRNVDRYPNTEAKNKAFAVFEKLDRLDPAELGAEGEAGEVPTLRFASDAQLLFDDWRDELEVRLRSEELSSRAAFTSHLSKYRKLMPALALLFHLIDWAAGEASGPVSLSAARRAAAWCDFLEAHAVKVYMAEGSRASAHLLVRHIKAGDVKDGATVRDLYRRGWEGLGTSAAVYAALDVLAEVGWLRLETETTGGRPSQVIRLHPALRGDA